MADRLRVSALATVSKIVLVTDGRQTRSEPVVRRYRLARLRVDGRSPAGDECRSDECRIDDRSPDWDGCATHSR